MVYQWKKTVEKVAIGLGELGISVAVCFLTDNNMYIGLIPILEAIRNIWKHT